MEHRHKPIVIKLHDHLHRGTETIAAYSGPDGNGSLTLLSSHEMEDDDEMSDLKWLVDFDLRTVCLYDIDGRDVAEMFRRKKRPDSNCRARRRNAGDQQDVSPNSMKHSHPAYNEMIASCLKGAGQVPVRDIYKWISEKFPELKLFDATWKNKVRYTLTTNPLFKKRRTDFGKRNVWYLDSCMDTKNLTLPPLYPKNFIFSKNPKGKRISVPQKGIQSRIQKPIPSDEENTRISCGNAESVGVQQSPEMDFTTQCWFPTGMYDSEVVNIATGHWEDSKLESVEYYELEIPIVTEYLLDNTNLQDPMEVKYLLEENPETMS